jgi:hypothetical protein
LCDDFHVAVVGAHVAEATVGKSSCVLLSSDHHILMGVTSKHSAVDIFCS